MESRLEKMMKRYWGLKENPFRQAEAEELRMDILSVQGEMLTRLRDAAWGDSGFLTFHPDVA